uniref:Uncharacterized protein n=1 Tax=Arundo donax TaxID=35708 RepID=A0A0A9H3Y3_ARUDO
MDIVNVSQDTCLLIHPILQIKLL